MVRKLFIHSPIFGNVPYVFRDEFTSPLDDVAGTDCEPGPGVRTENDVEAIIKIADTALQLPEQGTAAWGEESLYLPELTRALGQVVALRRPRQWQPRSP